MLNQPLEGLIERVAGATEGSRELDADIFIALSGEVPADAGRIDRSGGLVGWWPIDSGYESAREVPAYTSSIDAALGLVERLLPGVDWLVEKHDGVCFGVLWSRDKNKAIANEEAATAPLAVILALLSALRAIQFTKTGDAA